jgi:O-antigen/teichoic acid export membrane protein
VTANTWIQGGRPDSATGQPSRLKRNLGALAGGQLITWTMSLLWTLVVPRALGPAGTGIIVTALSVAGVIAVVLGLGTRNYLVREMVVNPSERSQLVATALGLRLLLAPIFVVAVVAYAHLAHYGSTGTTVLYLLAGAALLTLLAEPMQAGFQAVERMEYLAYSDVINKTAQAAVGIGLVALGYRAIGIAGSIAAIALVVLVLNARWLRSHVRIARRTSAGRMWRLMRASVSYWAFGLFFMFYLWIDTIMLSLMTRPEVVGWYGVPTRLFQTLMFLPAVVSTAWLPRLVATHEEDPRALQSAARRPLELVAIFSVPICAATVLLARPMIDILYGPAFAKAAPVLMVLGLCIPPMYVNIILNQVLIAQKRQHLWTWAMLGATIVNPLFNFALISFTQDRYDNGAIGAAASLFLTEILIVLAGVVMVGLGVFRGGTMRRPLLAAAAAVGAVCAGEAARRLGTVASLSAAAVVFAGLAWALRLAGPEELRAMRRALARIRRSRRAAAPQPKSTV